MAAETIRVVVVNMGAAGVGVPAGGATSQVLAKSSGTSYDTAWVTLTTAGTTVGAALLNLANPSAVTFIRINADNSVTALTAAQFATALGLGTGDSPTFAGATLSGGTLTGGASGLTFAAGGTNQNITLTPSGTGAVKIAAGLVTNVGLILGNTTDGWYSPAAGQFTWASANNAFFNFISSQFRLASGASLRWSDNTSVISGSIDTGLARASAGVVEINNGTAAAWRDLKLRNLTPTGGNGLAVFTVATLPATAATGLFEGSRAFVTDSNAVSYTAGIGSAVAAGGSTIVPVIYLGGNWRIG